MVAYGAIAELARMRDPRILLEGPANTGKTSGLLRVEEAWAWACPGIRVLLVRQTMQSLRESVLVTLEEKVWAPMFGGARHPAQHGTAARASRRTYNFPNGTTYVIGGLEDPGWTFSMEYDDVLVFEAWEVSKDSIEKLYRANRNHVKCRYAEHNRALAELVGARFGAGSWGEPLGANWMDERWLEWHGVTDQAKLEEAPADVRAALLRPEGFGCWQQIILDTNPNAEFHHVNQMAAPIGGVEVERLKRDEMPSRRVFRSSSHPFTRVLSRHDDNPACTDDDLAKLRSMTGHRRANLYEGLWTSAWGRIWPGFDPIIHMVSFDVERHGERDPRDPVDKREMTLAFRGDNGPHLPAKVEVKWAFGSMDLGFRNAGCLQVWLVDYEDRIYRAMEIHRREQFDDWWTERVLEATTECNLYEVVIDCEDPERIVKMNDRLMQTGRIKRGGLPICRGVDKSVRRGNKTRFIPTSLDLVREMLEPTQKGGPRMYWRRDALREGRDPISVEERWPTCSEEEIPSFVFPAREDGKADNELPHPACKQDGCAATRYAAVYFWLMDPKGSKTVPNVAPGSAGWRMGHADVLKRSQGWEPRS